MNEKTLWARHVSFVMKEITLPQKLKFINDNFHLSIFSLFFVMIFIIMMYGAVFHPDVFRNAK